MLWGWCDDDGGVHGGPGGAARRRPSGGLRRPRPPGGCCAVGPAVRPLLGGGRGAAGRPPRFRRVHLYTIAPPVGSGSLHLYTIAPPFVGSGSLHLYSAVYICIRGVPP